MKLIDVFFKDHNVLTEARFVKDPTSKKREADAEKQRQKAIADAEKQRQKAIADAEKQRSREEAAAEKQREKEKKVELARQEQERLETEARLEREEVARVKKEEKELKDLKFNNVSSLLPKKYLLIEDERLRAFSVVYLSKFIVKKNVFNFTKNKKIINALVKKEIIIINKDKLKKDLKLKEKEFVRAYDEIMSKSSHEEFKEKETLKDILRVQSKASKAGAIAGIAALTTGALVSGSWVFMLGIPHSALAGSALTNIIKSGYGKRVINKYIRSDSRNILSVFFDIAKSIKGIPTKIKLIESIDLSFEGYIEYPLANVENKLRELSKLSYHAEERQKYSKKISNDIEYQKKLGVKNLIKSFFHDIFQIELKDNNRDKRYYEYLENKRLKAVSQSIENNNPGVVLDKVYFDGNPTGYNSNKDNAMNAYLYNLDKTLYKNLTLFLVNSKSQSRIKDLMLMLNDESITNQEKVNYLRGHFKIMSSESISKQLDKGSQLNKIESLKVYLNREKAKEYKEAAIKVLLTSLEEEELKEINSGRLFPESSKKIDDKVMFQNIEFATVKYDFLSRYDFSKLRDKLKNIIIDDINDFKEYKITDSLSNQTKNRTKYFEYITETLFVMPLIDTLIEEVKQDTLTPDEKEVIVNAYNELKIYLLCKILSVFNYKSDLKIEKLESFVNLGRFKNKDVIKNLCFRDKNVVESRSNKNVEKDLIYKSGIRSIIE